MGKQTRRRSKSHAKYGGADCDGESVDTEVCNRGSCSVDCQWGEWSPCSVTCGQGKQTRRRSKSHEKYGGVECDGESLDTEVCNQVSCDNKSSQTTYTAVIMAFITISSWISIVLSFCYFTTRPLHKTFLFKSSA